MAAPAQARWCEPPQDGADGADGAPGPEGPEGPAGESIVGPAGSNGSNYEQEHELGIGVDYLFYEKGDKTTSNLNNISWLRSIKLENRIDLNQGKPIKQGYKGYVVFTIRKANRE